MSYDTWGMALLHFGWQGLVVAGVTLLVLRSLAGRPASIRYAVAVLSLVVMAALPVATAWTLESRGAAPAMAGELGAERGETTLAVEPQAGELPAGVAGQAATGPSTESVQPPNGANGTANTLFSTAGSLADRLRPALGWIVGLWIVGVVVLSIRLLGGWVRLRRLPGLDTSPVPERVRAVALDLASRLAVSRPVLLIRSSRLAVPAVVGWVRPVILLPASALTGLTPRQLEAIIAHELAHIRRHDYLVNLFQSVVETLLYFHPAVWWVSRQIRHEREHCCDDLAVAVCGGDRRLYAGALVDLEVLRSPPRLAVAADGGSIVTRVRRLLDPDSLEVEMFPRWTAALTAATIAVLIGLGGEMSSAAATGPNPSGRAALPAAPTSEGGSVDTMIVYAGNGAFAERLNWARETARTNGLGTYWIGYVVRPTGSLDRFIYSDRSRKVRVGSITMSGTIRGTADGLNPNGLDLASRIRSLAPDDVAILLEVDSRERVRTARVSSVAYRVDIGDEALLWIGSATAAESVPYLAGQLEGAGETWLAKDIVTAVGVHDDPSVVVPLLIGWLQGGQPDEVREEAAEWLAFHPDQRSLTALIRATGRDPSIDVRREGAEALGQLRMPEATEALLEIAHGADEARVRREAVEALADRTEDADRVLDELVSIARSDADGDVQREAVEAIGETQSPRRVDALMRVIRDHPDGRVQAEAIETLGEIGNPDTTIRFLRDVARSTPNERAAREAVETIGELASDEAGPALLAIVNEHPSERVQRDAVEAIAARDGAGAAALLSSVARRHPAAPVRREAIESLAEVASADVAVPVLLDIARADPDRSVRRDAIEALGEMGSSDALGALTALVRTSDSPDTREEAIESMIEMDDDAGLEAVSDIARTATDRETRFLAIDALRDSDDPRAADALEALLP